MSSEYQFVVVTNRLPVDEVVADEGERSRVRSPGGLVSARQPLEVLPAA
jgi:trehalose 6-phosphate synthase